MTNIINLKKYTPINEITHVTYSRQEIEQIFECDTCGSLQVIDGIVFHIKSDEEHKGDG